jgi:hypothetical protein
MSNALRRQLSVFLCVLLVLMASALIDSAKGDVKSPITVRLEASHAPLLGEKFEITCTVRSSRAIDSVQAWIELPQGVTNEGGETRWEGALERGQSISFSIDARFTQRGNWAIEGWARREFENGDIWGDDDYVYLHIGETVSHFGYKHPEGFPVGRAEKLGPVGPVPQQTVPDEHGRGREETPNLDDRVDGKAWAGPGAFQTVTVTVRFQYFSPFDVLSNAKWTTVYIFDEDVGADDLLDWGLTNSNGIYTSIPIDNVDEEGGTQDIYVILQTDTNRRRVETFAFNAYRWLTMTDFNVPSGSYDHGIHTIPNGGLTEGAMWIFQTMYDGYVYPPNDPGYCRVTWEAGVDSGAYFSRSEDRVYLRDADDARPDVILHEMGHNYHWNIYGDWLPTTNCPSPHHMDSISTVNCAWTEGWASFFAIAVTDDPVFSTGGSGWNLETQTWGTPEWENGEAVEGRVAGALWDIHDSANEGNDVTSMGFNEIWQVIYDQNDHNFAQFWAEWQSYGHPTHNPVRSLYQNTIDYDNTPVISGLPDRCVCVNGSWNNAIDLWSYTDDVESSDSELSFSIVGNTNPSAGVTIDSDRYIDINPAPGWSGSSTITVGAFDQLKTGTDAFIVMVPATAPATPTLFSASEDDCDKVHITWQDNSSIETGFKLYRNGVQIATLDKNVTSYDDYTASPCVTYSYWITAYNCCGTSSASASNNGTWMGAPNAPSACQASENDCDQVHISWLDNSWGVCSERLSMTVARRQNPTATTAPS